MKKVDHLFLIENLGSIPFLIPRLGGKEDLVVAFSIQVHLKLNALGIPHHLPDEWIDTPDLNEMGREHNELLPHLLEVFDRESPSSWKIGKGDHAAISSSSYFEAKVTLDTYGTGYSILEKLLVSLKPEKVVLFKSRELDPLHYQWIHGFEHLLLDIFLRSFSEVPHEIIEYKGKGRSLDAFLQRVGSVIRRKLSRFKRKSSNGWAGKKAMKILLFKSFHDLPYLEEIMEGEWEVSEIKVSESHTTVFDSKPFGKVWMKGHGRGEGVLPPLPGSFSESVTLPGVTVPPYLMDFCQKWHELLHLVVPGVLDHFPRLEVLLESKEISMCLSTSCRYTLQEACVHTFLKSQNIPLFIFQEGGGAGYVEWPLFSLDTQMGDHFLAYGEGVLSSPQLHGGEADGRALGSPRLHAIRSGFTKKTEVRGDTIYMMMDNMKPTMFQHYPSNGGVFFKAYENQKVLIDLLKKFPERKFGIKTTPTHAPLYEKMANAHIHIEPSPLPAVMGQAKGFIIEWPSTIFMECLMSDLPVLLLYFPDALSLDPEAETMLRKRCHVCGESGGYAEAMEEFLKEVDGLIPSKRDLDFVEHYVVQDDTIEKCRDYFLGLNKKSL